MSKRVPSCAQLYVHLAMCLLFVIMSWHRTGHGPFVHIMLGIGPQPSHVCTRSFSHRIVAPDWARATSQLGCVFFWNTKLPSCSLRVVLSNITFSAVPHPRAPALGHIPLWHCTTPDWGQCIVCDYLCTHPLSCRVVSPYHVQSRAFLAAFVCAWHSPFHFTL